MNTLFQMIKIGKIHPAKLILNSQSINGLNLLEIAEKNLNIFKISKGVNFFV